MTERRKEHLDLASLWQELPSQRFHIDSKGVGAGSGREKVFDFGEYG